MEKIIKNFKKMMNNINVKVKAKTGMDINFAMILLGIILFIILIIFIKTILGWVSSSLVG